MSSQLVWRWKPGRRRFQNLSNIAQLQLLLQTPGYRPQGRYMPLIVLIFELPDQRLHFPKDRADRYYFFIVAFLNHGINCWLPNMWITITSRMLRNLTGQK